MKTHDDIKKGARHCISDYSSYHCGECPYRPEGGMCKSVLHTDLLSLIQQLESTVSQVSKALCGKENATLDELLNAVSQVKNRIRDLEYALALMVSQYCRDRQGNVTHLWMTAGEHAFAALGIENYSSVEVVDEMIDRMEESMKEAAHADDP